MVIDGIGYEYDTTDNRIITIYTYKNGFLLSRESINRYDDNGKNWQMDRGRYIKN